MLAQAGDSQTVIEACAVSWMFSEDERTLCGNHEAEQPIP